MKLTEQNLRKIIQEEIEALTEDAGNLRGLPKEWIKKLTSLGAGRNSLNKATDVNTGQRNKLVALLRSDVDGEGIIGVVGYAQGTDAPMFMITQSWEERQYRLWLTDGIADIQRFSTSSHRGRTYRHQYTDTSLRAQELVDKIPDGDYTLYTITVDPERRALAQQRKAARGGEYKGGIRKDTLVKAYLKGKTTEIDGVLDALRNNLQDVMNDLFDPDADFDSAQKQADQAVELLKTELTKMKRARSEINSIFRYEGGSIKPGQITSYRKDAIMRVLKEL